MIDCFKRYLRLDLSKTRNRRQVQSDKVDYFDSFNIFLSNSIFKHFVKIVGLSLK